MDIGKLYRIEGDEFLVKVDYQFHDESPASWWGELVPKEYRRLSDGDGYMIELEDGRKGECVVCVELDESAAVRLLAGHVGLHPLNVVAKI